MCFEQSEAGDGWTDRVEVQQLMWPLYRHGRIIHEIVGGFLADRTNGRAYATVLRLSVVCDVMYCG